MESETREGLVILAAAPAGAVEGEVIGESLWGAIRSLAERGTGKKAIARTLGLDVKTVRKWLRQGWVVQKRRRQRGRLQGWEAFLRARAPEVGYNAAVLLRELRAQGFAGSYATLVRAIRPWRPPRPEELPTVRFETGPGEQAQVDWGSTAVWLGEARVRVHLFVMVLGYSRRIFCKAYLSEGLDALLDGHASAFAHFGGCTRKILYDNPRTIVLAKDEASGAVKWHPTFKDWMDFYGVTIQLCRYYRAQTKGKVESGVKYVKGNALAGRRCASLEELNAALVEWCLCVADERVHGTTHEKPADRFAREEAAVLLPVDGRRPPERERVVSRIVPRDAYLAIDTNRYPLPLTWAGREVLVRVLSEEIVITAEGEGDVRHQRLLERHKVARWNGPPRELPRRAPERLTLPPRHDPALLDDMGCVTVRPLSEYACLAEGALR